MIKSFLTTTLLISFFFAFSGATNAQTTASIDLVWEASSYTPPLYAGKALSTTDGDVDVVAFIPNYFGDPTQASYTWELNGYVLGSLSGTGRSSLHISGSPFITDRSVRVTVSSRNGQQGFGFVRIPSVKPRVVLYEDSALGGVLFSHALSNRIEATTDTDIVLTAYPYFFSTNKRGSNLSYIWKVDGQNAETNSASFVARSEVAGTSTVSIEARHTNRILEQASKILSVVLQ